MPGGFKWVGSLSDNPTGKIKTRTVASGHATRIAAGDLVRITSTADANGLQQVDTATATQSLTGVIQSIVPNFATEAFTDMSLPASTAGTVIVNEDPRGLYEADVSNGPLVIANVGLNADIVATAATVSGGLAISNMTVNATGVADTATLPVRIERLLVGSDGVLGSRCVVSINNHTTLAGATGV